MMLSHFQSIVVATSQMVVIMATTPDPDFPHVVASVGGTMFESDFVVNQKTGKEMMSHVSDIPLKLLLILIQTWVVGKHALITSLILFS